MNRFEFLKNYKDFANHVRYRTAEVLLAHLKTVTNPELQKALMLKIIEEVVASTEDLALWLIVLDKRNDGDKKYREEWERLLCYEITQPDLLNVLLNYNRPKTVNGFLEKLDFPPLDQLASKLGIEHGLVIDAVEVVQKTIRSAIKTRRDKSQIVVRVHNKMKHGMMVYSEMGTGVSWVRDFSVKLAGKSKRISRKDRSFDIPVDLDKAERIAGTIKSNSYAIESLINLVLIDYEYKIKSGKIRMRKDNKDKCLAAITKALN